MGHVVLLGDSIFDNRAYVGRDEPDVIRQLQEELREHDWRATLLAVDGSTTSDVNRQLAQIPNDATHLVVSVGGNDAIRQSDVLNQTARTTAEVLSKLASIGEEFAQDYGGMLSEVRKLRLPVALCTIYYPNFPDAALQRVASTALTVFNDLIIREAFAAGLPLIDLRLICNEDSDYANPIEPSAKGGAKIAAAIACAVTGYDFEKRRTEVFI
jgi:lysophospholipase L1-like esterase